MPYRPHRTAILATVLAGALALSGCAAVVAGPSAPPERPDALDNCGVEVPVTTPPKRVVTIKSTSTEMMLALGLGDRIVGTAFQDGPVPATWAEAAAGLPVLADKVPSQEVVLEAQPDLVYAA